MQRRRQIEQLADDPKAMGTLASRCEIGSPVVAGRVYSEIAPVVIERLHAHAESPEGLASLMVSARALTWTERQRPAGLFESDTQQHGEQVSMAVLGPSWASAVEVVALGAKITEANAGVFLRATTLVVLACLSGHPEQVVCEEDFLAPHRSDPEAVSDPSPVKPPLSEKVAAPIEPSKQTQTHPQDTEGGLHKGLILAGATAVVLLVGVAGVLAIGGDSNNGPFLEINELPDSLALGDDETNVVDTPSTTPAAEAATSSPITAVAEPAGDPDIVTLSVPMQDIEGTVGDAEGVLSFDFNTVTGEICYEIESINIDGPYRSHIHVGGADVKGGIVVDLGPQVSGAVGCVDNLAVDTNAILADPAGHYAELHDVTEEFTIRGQLSEATNGGPASEQAPAELVDTDGGGASILLDSGVIYLVGEVPDQETADELAGSLAAVDSETSVVNNLEVVDGAPVPSGRVVIADTVFFESASSEVKSIDSQTLEAMTALANSRPDWVLTVVGHTDSAGSDVTNLELSLARATALRDLLSEQGVPDENLRIRGAGETAPVGDNSTDAGRAQNRRIEFEFSSTS